MNGPAIDFTHPRIRELSGCPLRIYGTGTGKFLCQCSSNYLEDVTNYIMCEVDWESCPDYQADNSDLKKISEAAGKLL